MSSAFIFPGQGSQTIGMGKELYQNFTTAKEVFDEVDDTLNFSLSQLMFNGDSDELTQTQNAQPAIMANSIAVVRVIEKELGQSLSQITNAVAGHSLGEYSALCASGALSLSNTAKLLRIRGLAMQEAARQNPGAMAAIIGLSIIDVENLTKKASSDEHMCVIANDNSIGQIVISGHTQAIDKAIELAPEFGAKKAVKLMVTGAFHSPLMASASTTLKDALETIDMQTPTLPVVSNITAQFEKDPEIIKDLLVKQVTGSVRWTESVQFMYQNDINHFIECGNGKVLTGLIKRIEKEALTTNLETPEQIKIFL